MHIKAHKNSHKKQSKAYLEEQMGSLLGCILILTKEGKEAGEWSCVIHAFDSDILFLGI